MPTEPVVTLAEKGDLIAYFGYGSLVNPATHRTDSVHHVKASLQGFERTWQARPDAADEPVALLSSSPSDAETSLDGLLVFDHAANLPSLDEREAGYDRLDVRSDLLMVHEVDPIPECPVYVYSAREPYAPHIEHFILQSYLDAVLQGYLHQYGEAGVSGFIERTGCFETTLLMDRHTPKYPRHVSLTADERVLIDDHTSFMTRRDPSGF